MSVSVIPVASTSTRPGAAVGRDSLGTQLGIGFPHRVHCICATAQPVHGAWCHWCEINSSVHSACPPTCSCQAVLDDGGVPHKQADQVGEACTQCAVDRVVQHAHLSAGENGTGISGELLLLHAHPGSQAHVVPHVMAVVRRAAPSLGQHCAGVHARPLRPPCAPHHEDTQVGVDELVRGGHVHCQALQVGQDSQLGVLVCRAGQQALQRL